MIIKIHILVSRTKSKSGNSVSGSERLESLRRRFRFRLVVLHGGALGNVSFGSGLVEAARAVRTLDVVGILRGRWRRQVRQLAALGQVGLHLLGRPDGLDEFLVLPAPVTLFGFGGRGSSGSGLRRGTAGNGFLTRSGADLLLEDVFLGIGSQHSVLGRVENLTLLGLGLLADFPMLGDSVFGEVPPADGAPSETIRHGAVRNRGTRSRSG